MTATDRDEESVERARALVPASEELRGEHRVVLAARAPKPGYFRRPVGLRSESRRIWSWCMLPTRGVANLVSVTWNLFEAFFEAVLWREAKKPGIPFYGGWDSMAGHLARALHPRTKNGVYVVMQVTSHRLQLAYVSRAGTYTGVRGPAETGWATDMHNVAWIRDRSDVVGGSHEIAFVDGSWCSVQFMGHGWPRMASAFPLRLSHLDPVPSPR